jgi:predicted PurR-regulated permease PerM
MQVRQSATMRNAMVVIAVIVAGAALYWLRGILTPLALAFFLMIMVDGFARVLRKRLPRLGEKWATPLAITLTLLGLGLSVYVVADNITDFVNQTNEYVPRLNQRLNDIAASVGLAQEAPTLQSLVGRLNPGQIVGTVARGLQSFLSDAVFVLVYLGFLIATRRSFQRKSRFLFPEPEERREANEVFEGVRHGIEQYLWVQTVTGGMIAIASYALMAIMGESNAWFWAFFIFLTGYVPIIGAAVGTIAPGLFAFVEFQTLWQPLVILVGLQAINFFVGNVIYPRMQGDSLNLDPVVVLLALAFWGALWGLPGAFLSTPLTVTAMIVLAQFKGTRWIAVLISNNGQPAGSERARAREADKDVLDRTKP